MTCNAVVERLGRLTAGELDAAEAASIESHVAACEACRVERDRVVALERLLVGAFAGHPFDRDFARRIAARAAREATGGRVLRGFWRFAVPIAAAAALLIIVWPADREGATRHNPMDAAVAVIEGMTSEATIEVRPAGRVGSGSAVEGARAIELAAGDRVLVTSRGARVRFPDGTTVRVRPDTEIEVRQWAESRTESGAVGLAVVGGPGELFCDVVPRSAGEPAFRIETPFATAEVLGTRFGVRVEGNRSVTTVAEGRVRVRSKGADLSTIVAGGFQAIACSGQDSRVETVVADLGREVGWAMTTTSATAITTAVPTSTTPPTTAPPAQAGSRPDPVGTDLPIGTQGTDD